MPTFINRFGRRQTRGIRPWLLLPKVILIGIVIGSLASALVLWACVRGLASADPRRAWTIYLLGRIFRMIVPVLLTTLGLGVALLLQHPRQFIRMRWLIVKLCALAVLLPCAHWFASTRLGLMKLGDNPAATTQFGIVVAIALAGVIVVAVLGRLKPRLGQNWAKR